MGSIHRNKMILFLLFVLVSANPMSKCSDRGFYYEDTAMCECFQCFTGPSCETLDSKCTISDLAGSPRLFQEVFWANNTNDNDTTDTPPWYRCPYAVCQSCQFVSGSTNVIGIQKAMQEAITGIHKVVGNVNIEGKTIVYAHGATELIMATQWAHMQLSNGAATAFAQVPYYNGYPVPGSMGFNLTWSKSTSLSENDNIIEMLAYPNNPDGQMRQPFYNYTTGRVVHDMVYYWPHLIPESKGAMLDFDIMFFSMSKLSGHAGTRFGWAVVKDPKLAAMMQKFIDNTSIHISVDASHRAWRVLNYVMKNSDNFFSSIKQEFSSRWNVVNEVFGSSCRFIQHSRVGTFYPWVQCTNKEDAKDCASVFASVGVKVLPGTLFGATSAFVRMEMVQYRPVFDLMMERLKTLV